MVDCNKYLWGEEMSGWVANVEKIAWKGLTKKGYLGRDPSLG